MRERAPLSCLRVATQNLIFTMNSWACSKVHVLLYSKEKQKRPNFPPLRSVSTVYLLKLLSFSDDRVLVILCGNRLVCMYFHKILMHERIYATRLKSYLVPLLLYTLELGNIFGRGCVTDNAANYSISDYYQNNTWGNVTKKVEMNNIVEEKLLKRMRRKS